MFCSNPCLLLRRAHGTDLSLQRRSLLTQCWHCQCVLVAASFSEKSRNLSQIKICRIISNFAGIYRIFIGFWVKLLLKNTQGCFTMRKEVAESYMLNGNGVQKELFLTQPNFLIMPKINLNLLRKLASLVTWVNSRWYLALKKNFASLKKVSIF